ncbi:formimidoylglutamate deiminase [Actinoallomurus iriomotensis]|uniref:Formimidoylglutamate deiminase n=1 Tax=Actinoallomurus iriomotensis TaxID=478107 RepID=A0A9W6VLQ2_9ACTN|nr:formimidoylglutamate deiminase [Actinoallomurus iriomotensis]
MPVRYHAAHAWLDGAVVADVLLEVEGTRFTSVVSGVPAPPDAVRLAGLTLPGLANAHSHAFHRALRGRVQASRGTFWTWRSQMYTVAARLDPDSYFALARAVYAEMALAGISCVGEFHYLHHGPGGVPYRDANAMSAALLAAAEEAGVRITLLDACYLTGGIGDPLLGPQLRFGDGTASAWASRVSALRPGEHARVGAAIHSVRAVPRRELGEVAEWAASHAAPLHVHLSEQPAENAACLEAYGRTPAALLAETGALGRRTVAVHATHLTASDVTLLGGTRTGVCMCPTTERDLADGIGPARALTDAGSPLSLGSDQHAMIDLFEEARAVELDERLRTRERGHWTAAELLTAATADGHTALGWPEAGRLAPGAYADLVTVTRDSVRLAGAAPDHLAESVVFAASPADVRDVVVSGRQVVRDGHHLLVKDVPAALTESIAAVTG